MSTTVQPEQTASGENSRRIIPIYANLMPAEVVDARRGRWVRRTTLVGLAMLVVIIGAVYGVTTVQNVTIEGDLVAAEDQALQLTRQQQQFADVTRTQRESQEIEKQLTDLMKTDLRWASVLSSIRKAAPSGVTFSSVAGALDQQDAAKKKGAKQDTGLPDATADKPVGMVAITGTGPSKPVVAEYVDALAKVSGVTDPYLGSLSHKDKKGWDFTLRLTITEKALGGRFTAPDGKAGGN